MKLDETNHWIKTLVATLDPSSIKLAILLSTIPREWFRTPRHVDIGNLRIHNSMYIKNAVCVGNRDMRDLYLDNFWL